MWEHCTTHQEGDRNPDPPTGSSDESEWELVAAIAPGGREVTWFYWKRKL
jgi:hypothetical protein